MSRKKTGCKNCMTARQVTKNGVITFETPEKIEDLEEVKYTYNYAEASNYADNKQNIYKKKKTSVDLDLTFSSIVLKTRAQLQGKDYAKGGAATGTDDQSLPVAVLFQENYDDGSYENVVFYNVKLYEKDGDQKSEGENIEFTSQGFTGRGLSFTNDKITNKFEYRMDSADPEVDKEKLNNFFKAVQYYEAEEPKKQTTLEKENQTEDNASA